jgi:hypothetical protein
VSLVRRAQLGLKAALKRPFSFEELFQFCEGLLAQPHLPPELHHVASRAAEQGISPFDYWRQNSFPTHLATISGPGSWGLQRRELVRIALAETEWHVFNEVAQSDLPVPAWRHLVDGVAAWRQQPDHKLSLLIVQRWVRAVLTLTALEILGASLYGLDESDEQSFEFYRVFFGEIVDLDLCAMRPVFETDAQGLMIRLLEFKIQHVNPIVVEMQQALQDIGEQIASGSFDARGFERVAELFQRKRDNLSRLVAAEFPATQPGADLTR